MGSMQGRMMEGGRMGTQRGSMMMSGMQNPFGRSLMMAFLLPDMHSELGLSRRKPLI
jgi:hypothetical protein